MTWVPLQYQRHINFTTENVQYLSEREDFQNNLFSPPLSDLAFLVQQKRDYSWHLIRTFVDEAAFVAVE